MPDEPDQAVGPTSIDVVRRRLAHLQTARHTSSFALGPPLRRQSPSRGVIVRADLGVPFTSWAFGDRTRRAGLKPSFGSVGDGLDNAMMESFWFSMQIELLNRNKWKTRVELANVIFEYIKIFYNRQRRHSSIGYRTLIECELRSETTIVTA